ncbi:MAG: DedA family protein [Clostridium sp.]|uniref:DedA family protein n=1 Tax=Clostridium sp. TaxID=1506 RepID=UPI003F4138C9
MEQILELFAEYGIMIIFILVFLEHLNLPGLAAGVILGGIGIVVKKGDINLILALGICLIAALLGNIVLYSIGRYIGPKVIELLIKKFPKSKNAILKAEKMAENSYGRISTRCMPVVRTIVPIIEGGLGVKFIDFIKTSTIGLFLYNGAIVGGGYFVGYLV